MGNEEFQKLVLEQFLNLLLEQFQALAVRMDKFEAGQKRLEARIESELIRKVSALLDDAVQVMRNTKICYALCHE